MTGRLNLTCRRGATFSAVLTWRDETGVLVNLTGYTAEMDVRVTPADTAAQVITLTTGNTRIVLGGASATITLTAAPADTAALVAQTAWYDLVLTSPAGTVTTLFAGVFLIEERVTA